MGAEERQQPSAVGALGLPETVVQRLFDGVDAVKAELSSTKTELTRELGKLSRAQGVVETEIRELRRDVDGISKHFIGDGDSLPTRLSVLEGTVSDLRQGEVRQQQEKRDQVRTLRTIRWQLVGTVLVCLVTVLVSYLF